MYFLNSNSGKIIDTKKILVNEDTTQLTISKDHVKELGTGANDLKIFAISDSVLKPDFYSMSFLVVEEQSDFPKNIPEEFQPIDTEEAIAWIIIPIIGALIVFLILIKKNT